MDDLTFFSKDFGRGFGVDFSLRGARQAAQAGELGEWLQAYLSVEPRWANPGLATGLLKKPRLYSLFEADTSSLVRKCGPEPDMKFWQERNEFETHVSSIAASLGTLEDLPPLVVEEVEGDYVVCDGTH